MPEALEHEFVKGSDGEFYHRYRMDHVHKFSDGDYFGDVALQ
jgi:hypothetical protein